MAKSSKPSSMDDVVHNALESHGSLNQKRYDGVQGLPPSWVPSPLVNEFTAARDRLLRKLHFRKVHEYLAAYRRRRQPNEGVEGIARYPAELERDLESLDNVQYISALGEERGLQAYLGKQTHRAIEDKAVGARARKFQAKGAAHSAEIRKTKNEERNEEIRERAKSELLKHIAEDKKLSIGQVSRIARSRN
jgi:hypothetical protein